MGRHFTAKITVLVIYYYPHKVIDYMNGIMLKCNQEFGT